MSSHEIHEQIHRMTPTFLGGVTWPRSASTSLRHIEATCVSRGPHQLQCQLKILIFDVFLLQNMVDISDVPARHLMKCLRVFLLDPSLIYTGYGQKYLPNDPENTRSMSENAVSPPKTGNFDGCFGVFSPRSSEKTPEIPSRCPLRLHPLRHSTWRLRQQAEDPPVMFVGV